MNPLIVAMSTVEPHSWTPAFSLCVPALRVTNDEIVTAANGASDAVRRARSGGVALSPPAQAAVAAAYFSTRPAVVTVRGYLVHGTRGATWVAFDTNALRSHTRGKHLMTWFQVPEEGALVLCGGDVPRDLVTNDQVIGHVDINFSTPAAQMAHGYRCSTVQYADGSTVDITLKDLLILKASYLLSYRNPDVAYDCAAIAAARTKAFVTEALRSQRRAAGARRRVLDSLRMTR